MSPARTKNSLEPAISTTLGDRIPSAPTCKPGQSRRLGYIDAAKGIGIWCVAIGHHLTINSGSLTERAIWAFHIPLFFFLSGLTLSAERAVRHPLDVARSGLRSLGTPYLFFGCLSWVVWLGHRLPADHEATAWTLLEPLIRMLYGVDGTHVWLVHNQTLWFFTSLFSTQVLFACLLRLGTNARRATGLAVCLALVTASLAPHLTVRLPWNLDVASVSVAFYAAGFLAKDSLTRWSPTTISGLGIGLVSLSLLVVVALLNGRVDMNALTFGNPILFAAGALAGILLSLILSKVCADIYILRLVGEASLVVFPLHVLLPQLGFYKLFSTIDGYVTGLLHSNEAAALAVATVQIALCLPCYWALARWAPWLLGRRASPVGAPL